MDNRIKFREGTWDKAIFDQVTRLNEYKLDKFDNKDIVIDIGTHIGSFVFACVSRGAKIIYGFEACKENFEIANYNLSLLNSPSIKVHHAAVWRSDGEFLNNLCFSGIISENTGGGNVFASNGEQVHPLSLDNIIMTLLCEYKSESIRLLKLDCEGSEFPILLTCSKLQKVYEIIGEFHEVGSSLSITLNIPNYQIFNIEILKKYLEEQGFEVFYEWNKGSSKLGHFKAINKKLRMLSDSKIWGKINDLEVAKGYILSDYTQHHNFHFTSYDEVYFPENRESCLDFGCGIGRNFDYLKNHFKSISGYDLPNMINLMPLEEKSKVNEINDNWEEIKKNKYSVIHACLVLQHIDEKYLREYLEDFIQMSDYLLLSGRSWSDDNEKNVLAIVFDYYNIIQISTKPEYIFNADSKEQLHYTCLLKKRDKTKNILIVGSAPSGLELLNYKDKLTKFYDEIYCINNAWYLLKNISKIWCHSTDFKSYGTFFPEEKDFKYIKEEITEFLNKPHWYSEEKMFSGTMFLNVIYHIINTYLNEDLNLHIIGNDFDYSNTFQTHFYGNGKTSPMVYDLLKQNTPEFQNTAADPLRYGIKPLKEELNKILNFNYVHLKTLSNNLKQLLPYEKLSLQTIFERF